MSEDLPVGRQPRDARRATGRIRLHVSTEQRRARTRSSWRRRSASCGGWASGWSVTHSHGSRNTTHQCGTLVLRRRSARRRCSIRSAARTTSSNLFVVDASFFPSSAAVNPALTIAAQALRVADHITATDLHVRRERLRRESAIVQPRRHHRVGLQPGRAVLLGGLRLPAGRRGRHAARPRARASSASTRRAPTCKIGWIRVPGRRRARDLRVRAAAAAGRVAWNRVGLTHICFNVRSMPQVARLPGRARAWRSSASRSSRRAGTGSSSRAISTAT